MVYERLSDKYVIRLDPGDEITDCVLTFARAEGISAAEISAIGATDDFSVGIFNLEKKAYDVISYTGNHEIVSLQGTVSVMNGAAYQHLHVACAGSDGVIKGGHLFKAVISLTCEIVVTPMDGVLNRKRNESLGINQIDL